MTESFWVVPQAPTMRTPLSILREQAAGLTRATSGILDGEVTTKRDTDSDDLTIGLSIKVPALNNYVYHVLEYRQPITLYPGTLWVRINSEFHEVADEAELVRLLRDVLSSDEVQHIVQALWAQARELV